GARQRALHACPGAGEVAPSDEALRSDQIGVQRDVPDRGEEARARGPVGEGERRVALSGEREQTRLEVGIAPCLGAEAPRTLLGRGASEGGRLERNAGEVTRQTDEGLGRLGANEGPLRLSDPGAPDGALEFRGSGAGQGSSLDDAGRGV